MQTSHEEPPLKPSWEYFIVTEQNDRILTEEIRVRGADLVDKVKELVVDAFAKRPGQVWVLRDGGEVQIPLDSVEKNDIVIVNSGEADDSGDQGMI